jgi:predicted CXXCH cytochrome family protein
VPVPRLLLLCLLGVLSALCLAGPRPGLADVPSYLGSAACADCHQTETQAWTGSDHHLAWTPPTAETVLGDFSGVTFSHGGATARFLRDGETYIIETQGADGRTASYPVVGVAGVDPLQQYLLEPEPGRTQVFDIAWDVAARRWYPVFPDQDASPGNGFHWTGPYKSWEARCAECHATGYSRNYDPTRHSYAPNLAEKGVGCEGCHGPGAAHVAWAKAPGLAVPQGLTALGLTVDLGESQSVEVQQCMTCHSLREALSDGNPVPGRPYHDAFTLSLLRDGTFHADGSIQGEVFEGASFLQSKMFAKGVRCSDCHEPHSGDLRASGNAVCTQCHSPAGNPEFPSLPLKVFDGPEHTHHPEGSEGSQCTSCHMIQRTYMGIDRRHDHGFRIPRPDLASTGAPNGCTDCHAGRDAAWAAAVLEEWFPDSAHRGPHYATTIAAARLAPETQVQALLALAEWDGPGIVRASALDLLGPLGHAASAGRVGKLLDDPDPLVRAAAAGALRGLPPDERLELLMPVLSDPMQSVRVAAARALLDAQPQPGSPALGALQAAMTEWQRGLMLRQDFPETHLQIGGAALQMRNWPMAEQAFLEAADMDPQLDEAWAMVVRIQAALGQADAATATLQRALAVNPRSALLLSLRDQLGATGAP